MRRLFVCGAMAGFLAGGALLASGGDHEAVGTDKCAKMCHKVQLKSWETSKHAAAEPKVDCETCHGNGKDYIKLSVMKDRAQAVAAGLLIPDKATCTATCHKPEQITDEAFAGVHEHKPKK